MNGIWCSDCDKFVIPEEDGFCPCGKELMRSTGRKHRWMFCENCMEYISTEDGLCPRCQRGMLRLKEYGPEDDYDREDYYEEEYEEENEDDYC